MIIVDNWQWPQFVILFIFVITCLTAKEREKVSTFISVCIFLFILTFGGFFK